MTNANVSAVSSTDTAPVTETAATAPTAAPAKQEPCRLCGLEGKHELPAEPATCMVCNVAHGTTVKRGIPRGSNGKVKLVDCKVVVAHSLLALRAGGLKDNGRDFVNPTAPWESQAICDDCAYGLLREVSTARKEAFQAGAKRHEVEPRFPYPRIAALSFVAKWADNENAHEVRVREQAAERAAEREAAFAAERERKECLAALVAKGAAGWHRSGYERRGSVPALPVADRTVKNGGRRNERGEKRHAAPTAYVAEVEPADAADLAEYASAQT